MGADEAAFEIGVDNAGGLRCGVAFVNGPRTHFLHAGGEIGLQAEQIVARADKAVQAGLFHAHFRQEFGFFIVFQFGNVAFDGGANRHDGRVFLFRQRFQAVEMWIIGEAVFRHVRHIHGGFCRQQEQRAQQGQLFFVQAERAHGLAFVQMRQQFFQHRHQFLRVFVARFGAFAFADDGFFHAGQIRQRQFRADGFNVGNRIDFARNVDDVVVVKAAHHVYDGIGFADVGEELVAQAFAFAGTGHQACDIDKFDNGRLHALRIDDFGQFVHARVGHFHNADVRFDGAERIVGRFDAGFGQRVKQGGFADIGQAYDAAFQAHDILSSNKNSKARF